MKEDIRNTKGAVSTSKRRNRYNILRKVLIGFIVISLVNMAISYLFYTPKMHRIAAENRELVLKYEILQDRIASMQSKVQEIRHRDQFVYRPLFSVDTTSIQGIYNPYPASKYASFAGDEYAELMHSAWTALDAVTRQTYATSRSLDELQVLAKDKEQMSLAIPAIWPIDRTKLRTVSESLISSMVGCYTSMVRMKQAHKRLENQIAVTEKIMSYASLSTDFAYDAEELIKAKKALAFCEFHDVLPG